MKRLLSLILCMAISVSSVNIVYAEEKTETVYNTVSVEFSDSNGQTEQLQVMVKDNNLYANAEELGARLGYQVDISENYVSIYNKEKMRRFHMECRYFILTHPKLNICYLTSWWIMKLCLQV